MPVSTTLPSARPDVVAGVRWCRFPCGIGADVVSRVGRLRRDRRVGRRAVATPPRTCAVPRSRASARRACWAVHPTRRSRYRVGRRATGWTSRRSRRANRRGTESGMPLDRRHCTRRARRVADERRALPRRACRSMRRTSEECVSMRGRLHPPRRACPLRDQNMTVLRTVITLPRKGGTCTLWNFATTQSPRGVPATPPSTCVAETVPDRANVTAMRTPPEGASRRRATLGALRGLSQRCHRRALIEVGRPVESTSGRSAQRGAARGRRDRLGGRLGGRELRCRLRTNATSVVPLLRDGSVRQVRRPQRARRRFVRGAGASCGRFGVAARAAGRAATSAGARVRPEARRAAAGASASRGLFGGGWLMLAAAQPVRGWRRSSSAVATGCAAATGCAVAVGARQCASVCARSAWLPRADATAGSELAAAAWNTVHDAVAMSTVPAGHHQPLARARARDRRHARTDAAGMRAAAQGSRRRG